MAHRMVHTMARGSTKEPIGERERYSLFRGHATSPELGIGQMRLEPPSRYNGT